jgi:hypothetical protein
MNQAEITIAQGEAQRVKIGALTLRGHAAARLEEEGRPELREEESAAARLAEEIGGAEGPIAIKAPAEVLEGSIHHALFDLCDELSDLIEAGPRTPFEEISRKAEQLAQLAKKAEVIA